MSNLAGQLDDPKGLALKAKLGGKIVRQAAILTGGVIVIGLLIWQAITSHGNPQADADGISRASAILNTGILVFREGLEAILVLAALTASLVRTEEGYWKPVAIGAGFSFLASFITWFIVVAIITGIENSVGELRIQAATGLLAIIVLLVIMNWFFHKVYWTGWITHHNRRKRALTESTDRSRAAIFRGLAIIGFTSVYREGFEVVLFLQTIRLKVGSHAVLEGVCIGVALTLIVAMLTFVLHARLPYKKMLILTGIMLGCVLLVMVGEQIQEMQDAHWMTYTVVYWKSHFLSMPDWLKVWFGVFPTFESLGAQAFAAILVIGSYFLARRACSTSHRSDPNTVPAVCIVPDCSGCSMDHSENRQQSPAAPIQINLPSQMK